MGYSPFEYEALYRNRREGTERFPEHLKSPRQELLLSNECPIAEKSYPASVFYGRASTYCPLIISTYHFPVVYMCEC